MKMVVVVMALVGAACSHDAPEVDAGVDANPLACEAGAPPRPDTPYCNPCVGVGDAAPFCADGVYVPSCINGAWACVGDLIPLGHCTAGGPCQFVDAGAD